MSPEKKTLAVRLGAGLLVVSVLASGFWWAQLKWFDNVGIGSGRERSDLETAVRAYEKILARHPQSSDLARWAEDQAKHGATLERQTTLVSGDDAERWLQRAAAAYERAISILTEDRFPEARAAAQVHLAFTLVALGELSQDPNEIRVFLNRAENSVQGALETWNRDDDPLDWARAQVALARVFESRSFLQKSRTESKRLMLRAREIYRLVLEIQTLGEVPRDWAFTRNSLGRALMIEGIYFTATGPERVQFLERAIENFHLALEVRSPEKFAREWQQTQKNLALALYAMAEAHENPDWERVAEATRKAFEAAPADEFLYKRLVDIYHEILHDYEQAYAIHEKWLEEHPKDFSAHLDFTENHFTTGRFEECVKKSRFLQKKLEQTDPHTPLPSSPWITASSYTTILRVLEILALTATEDFAQAEEQFAELVDYVRENRVLTLANVWTWNATKHFLQNSENPGITARRQQLLDLVHTVEAESQAPLPERLGDSELGRRSNAGE